VSDWGDNVYPWTVISVSLHNKNQIKPVGLVQSGRRHQHLIKM